MYASNIEQLSKDLPEMDDEQIFVLFAELADAACEIEKVELSERVSYFLSVSELQAVVKSEMFKRGFTFVNC